MSTVHKSSKSPLDLNNVQYYYTELLFKKKKKKSLDMQQRAAGWIRTQDSSFQPYSMWFSLFGVGIL